MHSFQASLAFGAKPLTAPANFAPGPVDATALQLDAFLPADVADAISPLASKFRPPLAPARPPCPPAGPSATVKDPAGLTVEQPPRGGLYRWKKDGQVRPTNFPVVLPVAGFEQRAIDHVSKPVTTTHPASGTQGIQFTYETVQPQLSGNTVVRTTWQVKSFSPATAQGTAGNVKVRGGDPENGIVIKKIETLDATGKPAGPTFEPLVGLLMLPLPVVIGERISSVGVDPTTGETGQVQAEVVNKVVVDACGELIETWLVKGTQTFSGTTTQTRNFEDSFSLVLGGILAREKLSVVDAAGTFDLDFTIGQTAPDGGPS